MGGLEPVEVTGTLKKEEHPGEAGCKRVQCDIELKWWKGTMHSSRSWLARESRQAKAAMPLPEMQPGSRRKSPRSSMELQEPKELQGVEPAVENILNRIGL